MPKLNHFEDKFKLLINDSWGVYIPQHFTEKFNSETWGFDENSEIWQALVAGPDNENYWDCWIDFTDAAAHRDSNGVWWSLYQNGDLWAVAWSEMTEKEREKFGGDGF